MEGDFIFLRVLIQEDLGIGEQNSFFFDLGQQLQILMLVGFVVVEKGQLDAQQYAPLDDEADDDGQEHPVQQQELIRVILAALQIQFPVPLADVVAFELFLQAILLHEVSP